MQPTTHHLTVTGSPLGQHGKQIRGRVVYLQPKAERRYDVSAERLHLPQPHPYNVNMNVFVIPGWGYVGAVAGWYLASWPSGHVL
jgi:hypothetical protein